MIKWSVGKAISRIKILTGKSGSSVVFKGLNWKVNRGFAIVCVPAGPLIVMEGDFHMLLGKILCPGGGAAAQSQYGIRKFLAAATNVFCTLPAGQKDAIC